MPQLRARVLPENLEGTVKWNLTITYNRSTRNDRDTFQKQTPASEPWNITTDFGSNFYGGTATLTWTYTDSKNNSLPEQTFKFYIRGKNASVETIKSYIGDSPWFAKAIGAHESAPAQNGRLYC
jgi:type II secretory pathway pseudopilin PulG